MLSKAGQFSVRTIIDKAAQKFAISFSPDRARPVEKEYLPKGPLEQTNEPYAIANYSHVKRSISWLV